MQDDDDQTDWAAILANGQGDNEPDDYILITPEIVAKISLKDCEEQLWRSIDDTLRLAQAMKSAHLALHAALIAALAGSMNIGAHPEGLRVRKLRYYQEGTGERPDSDRVMSVDELLTKAMTSPREWTGQPLTLDPHERDLLARLSRLRDGIEHPKQAHWGIEIAYILEVLPLAARTTVKLLEVVAHHLEPGELFDLRTLSEGVEAICRNIQKITGGER